MSPRIGWYLVAFVALTCGLVVMVGAFAVVGRAWTKNVIFAAGVLCWGLGASCWAAAREGAA